MGWKHINIKATYACVTQFSKTKSPFYMKSLYAVTER